MIKFRTISWLTKLSVACSLISALLSLVSLISPHWICAKEIDWPTTTMVSHERERNAKAIYETFKQFTTTKEVNTSYDYEMITDEEEDLIEQGLPANNATLTEQGKVRVKVKVMDNETIPDLWQLFTSTNTTTPSANLLHNITQFQNTSMNNSSFNKYLHNSEERVDSMEVSPFGYRSLTPVNKSMHSSVTLYGGSEAINEEIELFLYNDSDTSKLVR